MYRFKRTYFINLTISHMSPAIKALVHQVIDELPENATMEDLLQELYEVQVVEKALASREAGRLVPHEEAKRMVLARLRKEA